MDNFKFENLTIWQKSMDLGEDVELLSKKFPEKEFSTHYDETFNLMNMMIAFRDQTGK